MTCGHQQKNVGATCGHQQKNVGATVPGRPPRKVETAPFHRHNMPVVTRKGWNLLCQSEASTRK